MPYEKIGRESATDILQQVDKILQSANTVLENHKDYLPSAEFAALKKAYCRQEYHWQMTNESQEDRAYYDKRIRESRILSQLYANRQTHQDRAQVLLYKVEAFQTKVLSASRNSHSKNALMLFEDELTESPEPPSTSTVNSFTSWFSFGGTCVTSSEAETSGARSKISLAAKQEDEFIVSVTHFPKPPNESVDSSETEPGGGDLMGAGNQIYRRMIAFENQDRRIEIIGDFPQIVAF
ncbi:TPR-2 domain protein [Rhizoctonia solani]|uniref:TPR-2 domain protein n=1 Tax=Rhizoctonia solani TaxID=456999 RepID=A0A8H8ST22_9AGAM|nr:TPR-2 domain protein [Rhizoctonia solani]QRW15628.1 TPR-2 domain protein [Rhizoctonia solani]